MTTSSLIKTLRKRIHTRRTGLDVESTSSVIGIAVCTTAPKIPFGFEVETLADSEAISTQGYLLFNLCLRRKTHRRKQHEERN